MALTRQNTTKFHVAGARAAHREQNEAMKVTRKIIEIDEALCNGCGECVPSCHEGAIQIIDGKAKLVAERYCDGLGACLGECPTGALKIVEREAEVFDEAAVEAHLNAATSPQAHHCPGVQVKQLASQSAPQCPSARIKQFQPAQAAAQEAEAMPSTLATWPIQIRLVPPNAPFLEDAHLLVAADCVAAAAPNFHRDFLPGRVLMMGCPKFDDAEPYVQKFTQLFSLSNINRVTVAVMQVPCCQGLPAIVRQGMAASGRTTPGETVVLSLQGEVLNRQEW